MNDRMTLFAFVARVRSAWDDWYGLVACLTLERAAERGYHKDWTLTDVIAHITWYEKQMIGILEIVLTVAAWRRGWRSNDRC